LEKKSSVMQHNTAKATGDKVEEVLKKTKESGRTLKEDSEIHLPGYIGFAFVVFIGAVIARHVLGPETYEEDEEHNKHL
jgi:hypothetical protein